MRQMYDWYLPPSAAEVDRVWEKGILTVDTNVLLDLYRYHDQTRQQLLGALEAFSGRLWLAHQVAEEFIRNRTTVIAGAAKTFKDAAKALDGLQKSVLGAVDTLSGYRLVPRPLIETLRDSMSRALQDATTTLTQTETAHPNYFHSDPILDRLLTLFTNAVGQAPTEDEVAALHAEGEQRKQAKIPPGYLDDDKEGARPYGDFILWRQVLLHAKSRQLPVLFVTSERKEDWWEQHAGKRVGPRRELLLEANRTAAQRILIYQTDQFVHQAATRQGRTLEEEVVREILEIGHRRDQDRVREPAVLTTQATESATPRLQTGQLTIRITRPLFNATGSGHLDPTMVEAPDISVELLEKPEGAPPIRLGAGTGTIFDFHVHLKSSAFRRTLPAGEYVVRYRAECAPESEPSELEASTGTDQEKDDSAQ